MVHHHSNTDTTPSSAPPPPLKRNRTSDLRRYVSKRRWWLAIGAFLVLVAMIIGIVFAAHKHYVEFGGQGFLKTRFVEDEVMPHENHVLFLPLRQINLYDSAVLHRSPKNVPYYACGDQQHSCEAYNQPIICCPVATFCYPTPITTSNVFCCNSTSKDECHSSELFPPKCIDNTFECSEETGGGCCPHSTICAPNGCIKSIDSFIVSGSSSWSGSAYASYALTSTVGDGNAADDATTSTRSVTTVTERPAATITGIKQGEVAENGGLQNESVVTTLYLPYLSVWMLVCVATIMVYL